MCYFGKMKDFDADLMECSGYMPAYSRNCYRTESNTITACPTGYKKDSNNKCFKIVNATYCKTGFTLREGNNKKVCIKTVAPTPVYSCKDGYTLNGALCTKLYIIDAVKIK